MYVRHLMNLDEYKHMNEEELTRLMFWFCDVQLSILALPCLALPLLATNTYLCLPTAILAFSCSNRSFARQIRQIVRSAPK